MLARDEKISRLIVNIRHLKNINYFFYDGDGVEKQASTINFDDVEFSVFIIFCIGFLKSKIVTTSDQYVRP